MNMSQRVSKHLDLLRFLKDATHFRPSISASPIYVIGNSSADLDSIISAIVYSYFATSRTQNQCRRQYIPIINLPEVSSGPELKRLRPEFATALDLATAPASIASQPHPGNDGASVHSEDGPCLKEIILTIADLKERLCERNERGSSDSNTKHLNVFMVDCNALPMTARGRGLEGISDVFEDVQISVLGCIDHHEDEHFIPPPEISHTNGKIETEPHVIQTGVGSCTSLVVRELRARGLWVDDKSVTSKDDSSTKDVDSTSDSISPLKERGQREDGKESCAISESQVAKLALAAILADTANMTAESKVSDVDREAVTFLEHRIKQVTIEAHNIYENIHEWDRQAFYDQIMHAKSSSVDNLTIDEILGRDYKEWIDTSHASASSADVPPGNVKLGICNIVRPLSWVIAKAAGIPHSSDQQTPTTKTSNVEFFKYLESFARTRSLDVVAVMTVFTSQPDKEFCRELLVWPLNDAYINGLDRFQAVATREFGLRQWSNGDGQPGLSMKWRSSSDAYIRAWNQLDVSKSRKQVAPLLRKALMGEPQASFVSI